MAALRLFPLILPLALLLPTVGFSPAGRHFRSTKFIQPGRSSLEPGVDAPLGFISPSLTNAPHQPRYYVDNAGNDHRDGKTPATAWQTVARANRAALGAGDTVLFKRGGVWHESLHPNCDGRPGSPVTFADYGAGAKPVLTGSDSIPINDPNWQPQGGNVYARSALDSVNSVLINHNRFLIDIFAGGANAPNNPPKVARDPKDTPYCWKWSGGTLTISAAPGDDPRTDGKLFSLCKRDNAICNGDQATGVYHNHLVFRNLVVTETANEGGSSQGYGVRIEGDGHSTGVDITVDGCESYYAGRHSFAAIDASQVKFKNCIAAYPMPNVIDGYTAYVSFGNQGPNGTETSQYDHCVGHHLADTWNPGDFEYEVFVDHGSSLRSVVLNDMQAQGNGSGDGDDWTLDSAGNATVSVQGGLLSNGRLDANGTGIHVDGLKITGPGGELDAACTNSVFQNMVVTGNKETGWYHTAVLSRGGGNIFRFNTIVTDPMAAPDTTPLAFANGGGGLTATDQQVYGNILMGTGLAIRTWAAGDTFSSANFRDNLYHTGATFSLNFGPADTLPQWQARGNDRGSLQTADPRFTSPAGGNFSLQPGSPAIDAAPLGTVTPPLPATDAAGHPRRSGRADDIGAYEHQ